MTTTQSMSAAEPLTEENERELVALARRYDAVGKLLAERDEMRESRDAWRTACLALLALRDEMRAECDELRELVRDGM